MPFDNKHFIGVTQGGYHVMLPIHGFISDRDMLEIAALIVAMKPQLKEDFEETLKRVMNG